MVTGDNILTAKKIAQDCHIYDPEVGIALEGIFSHLNIVSLYLSRIIFDIFRCPLSFPLTRRSTPVNVFPLPPH
jgi:magnesium-transporting ATPase (P-type)